MGRIVTISREFGSGGRELGKRLADALGVPCYDREIIDMVAEKWGLDKTYTEHMSERDVSIFYPTTVGRRFYPQQFTVTESVGIAAAEHQLIVELAAKGDCVIVGRCADVVLSDMRPLRVFVYADEASKIARCRERAEENEKLSDGELKKRIRDVDKRRAAYRRNFTEHKWADCRDYDLCVNTSGREIKSLLPGIKAFVQVWFGQED